MVSGVMWLVVVVVVLVVVVLVLVVMVLASVLLLFAQRPQSLDSHICWISEGTAFTCRYSAQAATPLHQTTLISIGSARGPCQIPRGGAGAAESRHGVVGALGLDNLLYKLPIKPPSKHDFLYASARR